jgi:hypothetical protein
VGESLEFRDQLLRHAVAEIGLDASLEGIQPQLRETGDVRLCPTLVGVVLVGVPPPQAQRLAERHGGAGRVYRHEGTALGEEALETRRIVRGGWDREHVPRRPGEDHRSLGPFGAVGFEGGSEPRHVDPKSILAVRPLVRAPEFVQEAIRGNGLVGVNEEKGEEGARAISTEVYRHPISEHLNSSE